MGQHDAVLTGDTTAIDLSTAENWATKTILLQGLEGAFGDLSEHVSLKNPRNTPVFVSLMAIARTWPTHLALGVVPLLDSSSQTCSITTSRL